MSKHNSSNGGSGIVDDVSRRYLHNKANQIGYAGVAWITKPIDAWCWDTNICVMQTGEVSLQQATQANIYKMRLDGVDDDDIKQKIPSGVSTDSTVYVVELLGYGGGRDSGSEVLFFDTEPTRDDITEANQLTTIQRHIEEQILQQRFFCSGCEAKKHWTDAAAKTETLSSHIERVNDQRCHQCQQAAQETAQDDVQKSPDGNAPLTSPSP